MQATMAVEIDEAIRRDPELLRDVEAATAYLDTRHEWARPPAVVRWELARTQPERPDHRPAVVLKLVDWPDYDGAEAASPPLSRVRTRGADYREDAVLRVWTKLLQQRSRVILDRLAADFAAEDAEREALDAEADGGR